MNSDELKNLSEEEAIEYVFDSHQERTCELCELYVLGCSSCSYHFMCEGRFCDQALPYIMEELIENAEEEERLIAERLNSAQNKENMALFGSSWKDEPTPEEQYNEITGEEFHGDSKELRKRIENKLQETHITKTERNKLNELLNDENL